jgi:epoxyqueuosine reductase
MILECAWDLGIDRLGFCDAEPLVETRKAIEAAILGGLIPEDVAPRPSTLDRVTEPRRYLKGARTVISAYQYYYEDANEPTDRSEAVVARYTRSNYYLDLKLKLKKLAGFMERDLGCRTRAFSCYVALAEKPLAAKAGIGYYGKHGVILTADHGSYVVLGELITDLALDIDAPLQMSCGSCTRCIDACPTGAITAPYVLDRNRCIQYLSERRGVIPGDIREVWGNRLYGCSSCQEACPHNADLAPTSREVFLGRVGASVPILDVLDMDETEFHARFSNNQISRRDPSAIRRNAVIAAGGSGLDSFLPALQNLTREPDPMMRLHSLSSICKIAGRSARDTLEKALRAETDPDVSSEIKSLLDGLDGFA